MERAAARTRPRDRSHPEATAADCSVHWVTSSRRVTSRSSSEMASVVSSLVRHLLGTYVYRRTTLRSDGDRSSLPVPQRC